MYILLTIDPAQDEERRRKLREEAAKKRRTQATVDFYKAADLMQDFEDGLETNGFNNRKASSISF